MKNTKKLYSERKLDLQNRLNLATQLRDSIINNQLREQYPLLNDIHDLIADLSDKVDDLDSEFETRNWTRGDWNSYELAMQNID